MRGPTIRGILTLLVLLTLLSGWSTGQNRTKYSYPDDAQSLFIIARGLWAPIELQALGYSQETIPPPQAEKTLRQASLFLEAATTMDESLAVGWHDLMLLFSSDAINDPGRALEALYRYSNLRPEDGEIIEIWLKYQINAINDRARREYFLQQQIGALGDFPVIRSEVLTQLGIFSLEKGDIEGGRGYFEQALTTSPYNNDALVRLLELPLPNIEQTGDTIDPQTKAAIIQSMQMTRQVQKALHWRLRLRNNPYDLAANLNLINALEDMGYYQLAQKYYGHAYTLMARQNGDQQNQTLKKDLRLRQLAGAYITKQYYDGIQIAEDALKESDPDDLLINSLLAKSMQQLGMNQDADAILQRIKARTIEKIGLSEGKDYELQEELAWFFCFIEPVPREALKYAHNALVSRPEDSRTKSILAYAQAMNSQYEPAQELLQGVDPNDAIAALTQAQIMLSRGENEPALQRLQAINKAHAGILAELVEQKIQQIKSPEKPPENPPAPAAAGPAEQINPQNDLLESAFAAEFNDKELSIPDAPEKFIQCYLRLKEKKDIFIYGENIIIQIYLSNLSDIPLLLGPGSFLDPHILLTAEAIPISAVASPTAVNEPTPAAGDKVIPLACRYLMAHRLLPPGRSNLAVEIVNIGDLQKILDSHPQQSYRIIIRGCLDPVADGKGGFVGAVAAIQPKPLVITRSAFVPSREQINMLLQQLRTGSAEERIKATKLLAGLLQENQLAAKEQTEYQRQSFDLGAIRQSIRENLENEDFRVRAWSAYALHLETPATGAKELQKLGDLLSDPHWFVRFMAIQSLIPTTDLDEYLRWAAAIDKSDLIKRQAQLLQGAGWLVTEMPPIELPAPTPESSPSPQGDAAKSSTN